MTLDAYLDIVGHVAIFAGAIVFLGAAIGLVRFDDLYIRTSAVATASSIGIIFIIVGVFVLDPEFATLPRAILAIALQVGSSAIGAIMVARAGFLSGARPSPTTRYSDVEYSDPERPRDLTGRADDGQAER